MIIKKGKTDVITYFNLVDSAAGTPETGLTITNIDATYTRAQAAAVKNDLTALAAATTAHTDNRGIEVDATNAPGLYRIDWPDAAFATGVDRVILTVTCSGCAPAHLIVELVDYDPVDGVRLGLTALPNAAAEAAGGLFTRGTGAGQINQAANGMIDTNPVRLNNVSQSLLDLKDFADDGYDPSTNKVQGVVLVDTTTTNTDMRGTDNAALAATALSTAQWTNARAGYLDNINNATLAGASFPSDPADQSLVIAATDALVSLITTVDTVVDAIKAKTDNLPSDPADASVIAGRFDTLDTSVAGLNNITAASVWAVGTRTLTAGTNIDGSTFTAIPWNAAWDAEVQSEVTDALNAALTEAYRSAGATGSVAQLLYEISAQLGRRAIASTTVTLKKLDGTTTAKTFTLNDATNPTAIEETT